VLNFYKQRGYLSTITLMDGLDSLSIIADQKIVMNARHFSLECGFSTEDVNVPVSIPATITAHHTPTN
jgi:hypothetical protein